MEDNLDKLIKEKIKEHTKFWTEEDNKLINESMKNIASRNIWDAISSKEMGSIRSKSFCCENRFRTRKKRVV